MFLQFFGVVLVRPKTVELACSLSRGSRAGAGATVWDVKLLCPCVLVESSNWPQRASPEHAESERVVFFISSTTEASWPCVNAQPVPVRQSTGNTHNATV